MKETFRYAATLLAFILVAYGLSWCAVYSFWLAAYLFHSVAAVRLCEAVGDLILLPVRTLFLVCGDYFDQSAPLTDPRSYAQLNAVLLGTLVYGVCRRFLFKTAGEASRRGDSAP